MKLFILYSRFFKNRILFFSFLILIPLVGYFFAVQGIAVADFEIKNPIFYVTGVIPVWLYIIHYLIFIFIISFVVIFILMLLYGQNKKRKTIIKDQYYEIYVDRLFRYLYSDEDITDEQNLESLKRLKKILKSYSSKRMFVNMLRKVHKQVIGVVREKNIALLNDLKYDKLFYAYLHSPFLRHKLFALKIISDFQLEGYENYILKLVKGKHDVLRSEALVALINLNIYDNLNFLVDNNIKINIWDINKIINTLWQHKKNNIYYSMLISSDNAETSVLGIMLARLHNRRDYKLEIKQKIGHQNDLVNEEAYLTLIEFAENQDDFDYLIDKFEISPEKVKAEIIKKMSVCPDQLKAVQFLEKVVESAELIDKVEALRVLIEMDLVVFRHFQLSLNEPIRQACLQVMDMNL